MKYFPNSDGCELAENITYLGKSDLSPPISSRRVFLCLLVVNTGLLYHWMSIERLRVVFFPYYFYFIYIFFHIISLLLWIVILVDVAVSSENQFYKDESITQSCVLK